MHTCTCTSTSTSMPIPMWCNAIRLNTKLFNRTTNDCLAVCTFSCSFDINVGNAINMALLMNVNTLDIAEFSLMCSAHDWWHIAECITIRPFAKHFTFPLTTNQTLMASSNSVNAVYFALQFISKIGIQKRLCVAKDPQFSLLFSWIHHIFLLFHKTDKWFNKQTMYRMECK